MSGHDLAPLPSDSLSSYFRSPGRAMSSPLGSTDWSSYSRQLPGSPGSPHSANFSPQECKSFLPWAQKFTQAPSCPGQRQPERAALTPLGQSSTGGGWKEWKNASSFHPSVAHFLESFCGLLRRLQQN